ncbi:MAG: OmpA family protein [Pseudomonadota bacterium]
MSAYDTFAAGLSVIGLGLVGFVATHGTSEFHKNPAQIEAILQTKAEVALSDANLDWANVELDGQTATIWGQPPSEDSATLAEQTILASAGRGGALFGGVVAVETDFSEIISLPVVSPYVWRATKTEKGRIVLNGSVPTPAIQAELATTASAISGGNMVDQTELAAGQPDGDWAEVATFALSQLELLDSGNARLRDRRLSVSGISMDDADRIAVSTAVSNIAEPWQGVASVTGPSLWKAKHVKDTLVLSGTAETEADKNEIASIAQANFDGDVIDRMTVASSEYADWIGGVRLGLPHFADFESGEMLFEPEETGFEFKGKAAPSTLQFLAEDMATLGSTYNVDISAQPSEVILDELSGVDLGDDPLIACQASFDLMMTANTVVFESGSAVISRESGETLDKIMAVAATCNDSLKFEVGGHTDSSGDASSNISLSRARAQAVSNYMQAAGFDANRLLVVGYGPERPVADNSTPEGRAENRRIEFSVQAWSE